MYLLFKEEFFNRLCIIFTHYNPINGIDKIKSLKISIDIRDEINKTLKPTPKLRAIKSF